MNLKLLVARKQLELSQDALAESAKVPQADISKIEARGWIPPKDIQDRLAAALNVTAEELFPTTTEVAS